MTNERRLVPEMLVAVAAGVGIALAVLGPADAKLSQARARSLTLRAESSRAADARDALPRNQARLEHLQGVLARLSRQSEHARDVAALYADLEALATRRGVRVEQIDPSTGAKTRRRDQDRIDPRERREGDAWVSLSMVVFGDLASITALADDIEQGSELARIDQLEFLPGDRPGELMAQMRTTHGAVDVCPLDEQELAALEGAGR
jgi:hypothetical protein